MTKKLLLSALILLASLGHAHGQAGVTGTILGRVSDVTDAAIPGATVTIIDTATGLKHVLTTNNAGEYTAAELPTGPYSVKVQAPGFGARTENLAISVAQQARVDAQLTLGTAETLINVDASAVTLDTETSSVSQLVSQKQVDSLPLNGRNFLNLLFIGAGAVQTVGEQGQMRQGEGNAISINGGRPESNNYTLDGMSNTDTALNTPSVILSQDAIQEFKVQSETYSAEFGFSANQVNIVSKSGTNQLHGSGFEFLRNDALDASTHFQTVKPKLRQNQFGFVVGGPVFIPKLYDGRNRTFFLANYEGWRIILGTSSSNVFVPTPKQLLGDFGGSGLPAYGTAACTAVITVGGCQPIDPNTGQPFPGSTIPSSRFSKIANVALAAKLFPAPNVVGTSNGFSPSTSIPNSTNQQTYRLDQSLGKLGNVFGRYTKAAYITNQLGTDSIPFGLTLFTEDSSSWEISHTISLGSRNVNNIRYGQLASKLIQGVHPAPQADIAALGLAGVFTSLPDYARGYPTISIGGYSGNFGSPGNDPVTSDIPQWEIADSFTSSHGKHTLSAGFDYRSWIQKRNLSSNFTGSYGYSSNTILQNSTGCTTPSGLCGTGNATADFLLGYYSGASTFQPGPFSTAGTPGNEN